MILVLDVSHGLKQKNMKGKNMINYLFFWTPHLSWCNKLLWVFLAELLRAVALNGFHSCIPYGSLFLNRPEMNSICSKLVFFSISFVTWLQMFNFSIGQVIKNMSFPLIYTNV